MLESSSIPNPTLTLTSLIRIFSLKIFNVHWKKGEYKEKEEMRR